MDAAKAFRNNLKQLIESGETTPSILKEKASISRSSIYGWLDGTNIPNLEQVQKVCDATGRTVTQMLQGEGLPPPKPRKPTALEVAIYLFENGAPEVDKRAVGLFKKALTGSEAQLKVLEDYVDSMFTESVVDGSKSGAGSDGSSL